jgi:asparaginyl-tRNA synthetase
MKELYIEDVLQDEAADQQHTLSAWVYRIRTQKSLAFLVLRDSTGIVQAVVKQDNVDEETWNLVNELYQESSVEVTGTLKKDERAPTGYELQVSTMNGVVGEPFPIQEHQSKELLADQRHLWLRSRRMTDIMKVRHAVFQSIRSYFNENSFYEFHSPIFQSTQSEGGSEVFEVDYFDRKMYLAQTWQLPAEAGIYGLENIYTIAPSFRAEKSRTSRHLTEYWHAEMEMAWCTFEDVQDHAEDLLKHVVNHVCDKYQEELERVGRSPADLEATREEPFPRMTYTEALEVLKEECDVDVRWGEDLGRHEETALTKLYDKPIIVTDYPKEAKAFYMKETPGNSDAVQGCDVLAPEGYGEIVGGSQREEDIEEIKSRLREEGEDPDDYDFYLDTRRYGSVPHGGFGLGVERVIAWILGLDTVKEAIPFPRTVSRVHP